jgi:DNA repair protein RadD
LHVKKDTGSRSMRVTYYNGVSAIADEWICVEHAGFAYEKAWSWWNMRSDISMPKTVEEAIELTKDFLVETVQIKVKKDGKFSRIVDYTFGEPDAKPEQNELGEFVYCEDDIPF